MYCGGSEGFTVGADLVANQNKHVTHTILFSGKQGRRFEQTIRTTREQVESREVTPEEGQKQIDELYRIWEDICRNPTAVDKNYGDTYRAWYSFSQPVLPNTLKIDTPLYIAYGTADKEMAPSMDTLPLEFIANGKKNLTLKPYYDHDHQFFQMKRDASGKIIDKVYRGDEVARDWMEWLRRTPSKLPQNKISVPSDYSLLLHSQTRSTFQRHTKVKVSRSLCDLAETTPDFLANKPRFTGCCLPLQGQVLCARSFFMSFDEPDG